MTRTAKTPRLIAHIGEPFLEVHPIDAESLGLKPADLAQIESTRGEAILRVVVTSRQRRGSVFAQMHWTDQYASLGRVGALISGAVDPISGQPELKFTPVAVRRYAATWHAFAVSLVAIDPTGADYFALATTKVGFRAELAGIGELTDGNAFAARLLGLGQQVEWLRYHDAKLGQTRCLAFEGDRLAGAFFAAREPVAVARAWLGDNLGAEFVPAERLRMLAGRPGAGLRDRGPTVCACFEVGGNEIRDAVVGGQATVDAIGETLKAGTNCGSCRSEIARIIADAQDRTARNETVEAFASNLGHVAS